MKRLLQLCFIILLASCQKDDSTLNQDNGNGDGDNNDNPFSDNFGQQINATFIGEVLDVDNAPLENVTIKIGAQVTQTDENGIFVIRNAQVFDKFAYVQASKDGYLDASRSLSPKPLGTNIVRITMLQRTIVGTFTAGTPSTINTQHTTLNFPGQFVDSNNNPYSGTVEVSYHYLDPTEASTFRRMPGMLFGQSITNEAVALETYGMIKVDLFSPSGERLNIDSDHPVSIEHIIDPEQLASAPQEIPLWSFDESVGYWKEEGLATKQGDKYVGEVPHFSTWNWDVPFSTIDLCVTVVDNDSNDDDDNNQDSISAGLGIQIISQSSNQLIYQSDANQGETVCSAVPANTELVIRVLACGTIVHEENIGSFSNDDSVNITATDLNIYTTNVVANIVDCAGNPVQNGYVRISNGNSNTIEYITDGTLNTTVFHCGNTGVVIWGIDLDTGLVINNNSQVLSGDSVDLGTLSVCDDPVLVDDNPYSGNLILSNQEAVNSFGANNYTSIIGGDFAVIEYMGSGSPITDLSPLITIMKVNQDFRILNVDAPSLFGLNNLEFTGNSFFINNCDNLIDMSGLENFKRSGQYMSISDNASLETLDGMNSLLSLGGITNVISNNPNLTDFCVFYDMFLIDDPSCCGDFLFQDNGYNPTLADVMAGNCSQ